MRFLLTGATGLVGQGGLRECLRAADVTRLGAQRLPQVMTTTGRVGRAMLQLLRMQDPPAIVENAQINRLGELPPS